MSSRPKPWYSERDCLVCTRSASSFYRNPLYSFAHAMWVKWWYHAKFWHFHISFCWIYLNYRVSLCSKCTIQSHIINFQPFLTSFGIFHAFTDLFLAKRPWIEKHYKWTLKRLKVAWNYHFTHIACARKLRWLQQKLDALRVQNRQSLWKYEGFGRKLMCYKGISFVHM